MAQIKALRYGVMVRQELRRGTGRTSGGFYWPRYLRYLLSEAGFQMTELPA